MEITVSAVISRSVTVGFSVKRVVSNGLRTQLFLTGTNRYARVTLP